MDSVPYIFCEDVLERLSKENLYTMAELSGQWRSAAQRFIEKRQTFNITISKDSEEWFYSIANENTVDIGKGPHSHEEFLSMDRRYLEVYGTVEHYPVEELKTWIPSEWIPFRTSSVKMYWRDCPERI
ncbi:hypothetical protein QR680_010423 [Steinernema hermaphroditum]|uniref:F-box domain-containing protein n=1 Tax=Steinernema hermaphroditum TaxID=289476 RepID=A0AA39IRC9_9BILA|nr:hypothetical protein QR680_010423 [Steinernema hermaphroditum]